MEIEKRIRKVYEDIDGQRVYFDVCGNQLNVGDKAPDFILLDDNCKTVRLGDLPARKKIFNLINSVYTSVCDKETCRLDDTLLKTSIYGDSKLYTISMNLPFVLNHFRKENDIHNGHFLLSDHRTGKFGIAYGALMIPDRLLQRTAIVLDKYNTVLYAKYFEDQGIKPDYTEALDFLLR